MRDSHESPGASPEPGDLALQEGLSWWLVCLAAWQFIEKSLGFYLKGCSGKDLLIV